MKIYVASSWRCVRQPGVVKALRAAGFTVYDFKNPPDRSDFQWSEIDPNWQQWSWFEFRECLEHPRAKAGFVGDFTAMQNADVCVLVLPCGRSACLEAGWFVGKGKPLIILLTETTEPELMYKMAHTICGEISEVIADIRQLAEPFTDAALSP